MNRLGIKIVALLAFLSMQLLPARSVMESVTSRVLNMETGLPSNYVDDVLVDSYGFLWIATSGGGLCRYDGYNILTFNSSTETAMQSVFVRNLAEDGFGRLWVASEGGLDVINLKTLEKEDCARLAFGEQSSTFCSYVILDSQGCIWTKFGKSIYRLEFGPLGEIGSVMVFSHDGMSELNHVFMDVDGDGSVWTRLGSGLYKLTPLPGGGITSRRLFPSLSFEEDTYVSDFLKAHSSVWVASENGLYRIDPSSGKWKVYGSSPSNPRSLTQNFVSGLSLFSGGRLAVSTLYGLNFYDPITDDFERYGDYVANCVKFTGSTLLLATEVSGLYLFTLRDLSVRNYSHSHSNPSSIAPGAVNAVWQDSDGTLWVGSREGGLSVRPSRSGDSFLHITRQNGGLSHNSVSAIRPGGPSRMYIGTWGGGIDLVSTGPRPKVLRHLSPFHGFTDYIGVLEYDERNSLLWIGSNRGIFTYDPSTGTYTRAVDTPATGCIGSCIDSGGRLWVGCQEGMYVFDLTAPSPSGVFPHKSYAYKLDMPESGIEEKYCCFMEASSGKMYVGSDGGGVYELSSLSPDSSCRVFSTRNGLSNDRVRGFCEDASGRIWISTEFGLNVLNPGTGVITSFFSRDGLASEYFIWNNSFTGTDGLLYFGSVGGLSAVDASPQNDASFSHGTMRFTGISVAGKVINDPSPRKIVFGEKEGPLAVSFSYLAARTGYEVTYKYRLDGLEKEPQSLRAGYHEVSYNTLPSGSYTFEVTAIDRYGNPLSTISLPVRVVPVFYHTLWFFILALFCVTLLVIAVIWQRTGALQKRKDELERVVQERTGELKRQNEILQRQNEELASRAIILSTEKVQENKPQENVFVKKVMETLRNLYKDPNLDVDAFCKAMGMSKTLLNTKLQSTLGQSIGHLVRTYRLRVAKEILENGSGLNVSEVAYEVGFNDPKYFTRCFTKEFGVNPSAVSNTSSRDNY